MKRYYNQDEVCQRYYDYLCKTYEELPHANKAVMNLIEALIKERTERLILQEEAHKIRTELKGMIKMIKYVDKNIMNIKRG